MSRFIEYFDEQDCACICRYCRSAKNLVRDVWVFIEAWHNNMPAKKRFVICPACSKKKDTYLKTLREDKTGS